MVHVSGFLSSRLKVARLGFILSDLVKNVNPTVLVGYIFLPFLNKTAVRIESAKVDLVRKPTFANKMLRSARMAAMTGRTAAFDIAAKVRCGPEAAAYTMSGFPIGVNEHYCGIAEFASQSQ